MKHNSGSYKYTKDILNDSSSFYDYYYKVVNILNSFGSFGDLYKHIHEQLNFLGYGYGYGWYTPQPTIYPRQPII
jgi:hypothetical protein